MSLEKKFVKLYTEYAEILREHEKNTAAIKKVILNLDFDKSLMRHFDKIHFIIRSLIISMKFSIKDAQPKHASQMLKCYEKMLDLSADQHNITRYISIVNLFTSKNDLENCLSVFMDPKLEKSVQSLLHTCSLNLEKVGKQNSSHKIDLKELYLSLSRAVLVFIRLETAMASTACGSKRQFTETKLFLDKCSELDYFVNGHDTQQYLTCFQSLKLFLNLLETESSFNKSLAVLREQLEFFVNSKIVRATLVMDTAVTLAEFVISSQKLLIELIDGSNLKDLFSFMYRVIEVLRSTKYPKTFCIKCDTNIGIHQIDSLTTVACEFYKKSIEKDFCDASITEVFSKIYSHKLMSVSLLVCEYAQAAQTNAVIALNQIVNTCSTVDRTAYVIPILHELMSTLRKTKLTQVNFEYNEVFILRKLLEVLKTNEDWKEMIRVGYLAMVYLIVQKGDTSNTLHNMVYSTCLLQQTHKDDIKFFTPCTYLTEKSETFYNMKLPSDLDYTDILLIYFKLANLYMTFPIDFNNNIVDQVLELAATKTNPQKYLRFVLYTDNITYDLFHERIQAELKRTIKQENEIERNLLFGAFKFAEYLSALNATSIKYKHVSISEEMSRKQSSLFEEQNLNFEMKLYEMLLYVKRSFNNFLEYYFKLEADDRSKYQDEIQFLMIRIKLLARHFSLREYPIDAIEAYGILYKLAESVNDEFGVISACSYFAENSQEFERQFANKMNLSNILEQCYKLLVNHLENMSKLSLRKQNEVFYCLLNISLYYLSTDRLNDAKKLLQFIHLTIGPSEAITKFSKNCNKTTENEKNEEKKIQYEAVRIKYYSVLFFMIIKYKQASPFSLANFTEFIMYYVRSKLSLTSDDTINVPNILFVTIPELIMCGLNRYDMQDIGESLLTVLLKFSIRMGLVRRSIKTLIMLGLVNLFAENIKCCENKISFLENIFLIHDPTSQVNIPEKSMLSLIGEESSLINIADPIRKEGSTMKFLSPHKVIKANQESYVCRYLLDHPSKCTCIICQTPSSNLFLFQISCLHMRSVYLNVANERINSTEYKEIHRYWFEKLKNSELTDNEEFLIYSVRMLMWCGHYIWRGKSNLAKAEKYLSQSYEWLKKISNYDRALEEDILMQIESINSMNSGKNNDATVNPTVLALNHKKNFNLPSANSSARKAASTKTRNDVAQRRLDLLSFTAGLKSNMSTPTFKVFDENNVKVTKNTNDAFEADGRKEPQKKQWEIKQSKNVAGDREVICIDSSPDVAEASLEKKSTTSRRAPKEKPIEQKVNNENSGANSEKSSAEDATPRVTRSRRMKNSR